MRFFLQLLLRSEECVNQVMLWPYAWYLCVSDPEWTVCYGHGPGWKDRFWSFLLWAMPLSDEAHLPNSSRESTALQFLTMAISLQTHYRGLMKILEKQGLLVHHGISPYCVKIIAWLVAIIKEDLIVLFLTKYLCSHIQPGNREMDKMAPFSKATGRSFRGGKGIHLPGIPAWGPCPAL